jgi:UDP-glucose 4-epimerase
MHIFITGVAGFLGSHLAENFLKKNYTVTGNDTLVGGSM